MIRILTGISDHLLYLVLVVGAFSLFFPGPGSALGWIVTPVLALMVLSVSMTIKAEDLKQLREYPFAIICSLFLQFVLMAAFSLLLGTIFFPRSAYILQGQLLLGSLPADISAPLMVYLVRGNTALATAMLVIAMILTPFVLPNVINLFGGVSLTVPTSYLVIELIGIIIIPVALGILLNYYSVKVQAKKEVWSGVASLCYVTLLFVVVSSNARTIIDLKAFALVILFVEIALNLSGYGLAYLTKIIFKQKEETFMPLLFIASSKEFGIASAAMDSMKLNTVIVIPSAFYAVVQMISSPIMVKVVKRLKSKKI